MDTGYESWLRWWRATGHTDLQSLLLRQLALGDGDRATRVDVAARYATRIGMRMRRGTDAGGIADVLAELHAELGMRPRKRTLDAAAREVVIWYSGQRNDQPELFDATGGELAVSEHEPCVPVPGGVVSWSCGAPSSNGADHVWPGREAMIFAWTSDPFCIELRVERRRPDLPAGMEIVDGWIGHWRVRGRRSGQPPALSCSLAGIPDGVRGEPATAEHLDAQSWELAEHRISIGTFDADALAARAGTTVPAHWRRHLVDSKYGNAPELVRHDPDGLTLQLPELRASETCEVHHAVAWQHIGSGSPAASWYAVDLMGAPSEERWLPSGEGAWRSC